MASPLVVDVKFDALGKKYVYRFGTHAMAILERKTKMKTKQYFESRGEDYGVDDIVLLFHCALLRSHPDITEVEVCEIIDEIGTDRAGEIVQDGFVLSAPPKQEAAGGAADPHPVAVVN